MRYLSTRNRNLRLTAAGAVVAGLAGDGGLFVPEVFPNLGINAISSMRPMSYNQRAVFVMGPFLENFSYAEITSFTDKTYSAKSFDTPQIAPLHHLDENTAFLELWHGPTCAFKDIALQMLPYLLTASMAKIGEKKAVCVLVATSGDTGKAALEGFCDVEGVKILVFYPKNGVSDIQKLQMTTQRGNNVAVCAVAGNFDDTQTGVKRIFSDTSMARELAEKGYLLSSANSINWGRLLPQIVYYVSAYCDMLNAGRIGEGDRINVCVPTGNFGNILAAYYAKQMGLPIGRLICASNENNVLTEFIRTGAYNRNRAFFTTISPSMDILISSNLERLLFDVSGRDDKLVAGYMGYLAKSGAYSVDAGIKKKLAESFWAQCCGDEKTKKVINATYRKFGYLIDPHTAVAFDVLNHYRCETGDDTPAVVVSTASPYKFCGSVLDALGEKSAQTGLDLIDRLAEVTGTTPPEPLLALRNKRERFGGAAAPEQMPEIVRRFLQ